ncbi:MAG: hypothetical protein KDD67_16915 [Ignavibacteriae bacterium]|nr:hypothetical protein [Ignavibacteriota bacterium]MCB9217536.1 hypothetical protein [Ignavibacteria bacterium]
MRLLGQMSSPLSVAAVIFIAVALSVVAQTPDSTLLNSTPPPIIPKELWRAGIYFGMSRNFYQADHIKGLPNVPSCCPDYTSGNGAGIGASVLAELPLSDQWRTGWRLSYASLDGQLRTEEFEEVNSNRGLVLATFEHTIAADITALGLESYVGYELFNNLKLFAGLRGDFLTGQGFRQEERLAAPEGITYENGSRIRMNYEGDIADAASLHVGVISMVRYELSISDNHDWVLAPEVGGWYGLTTLVKDLPWQVHGARVGISIQYIARDIPNLLADPVDLIVPIGSKPGEASGSERDKVEEKEGEK